MAIEYKCANYMKYKGLSDYRNTLILMCTRCAENKRIKSFIPDLLYRYKRGDGVSENIVDNTKLLEIDIQNIEMAMDEYGVSIPNKFSSFKLNVLDTINEAANINEVNVEDVIYIPEEMLLSRKKKEMLEARRKLSSTMAKMSKDAMEIDKVKKAIDECNSIIIESLSSKNFLLIKHSIIKLYENIQIISQFR